MTEKHYGLVVVETAFSRIWVVIAILFKGILFRMPFFLVRCFGLQFFQCIPSSRTFRRMNSIHTARFAGSLPFFFDLFVDVGVVRHLTMALPIKAESVRIVWQKSSRSRREFARKFRSALVSLLERLDRVLAKCQGLGLLQQGPISQHNRALSLHSKCSADSVAKPQGCRGRVWNRVRFSVPRPTPNSIAT